MPTQIRKKTYDELLAENERLLIEAEVSRHEIIELQKDVASLSNELAEAKQIIQRREAVIAILERDIHQLELQIEAIGAGGVSSQRITGTDARWYAVGADGMATLCINREDARDTAAEAAQLYPNNAPYTAVQLVPVGEGDVFGGQS